MVKALNNHPGMWLADDAADAINTLEDKYGVIRINRAGVTVAQQQDIIDRWDAGDREGLFEPKRPAEKSNHVPGLAVDVYNYTSDKAKLEEFGFEWYGPTDPVHYTFKGWKAPVGKDDDMVIRLKGKAGVRDGGLYLFKDGKRYWLGAHSGSGFPLITDEGQIQRLFRYYPQG